VLADERQTGMRQTKNSADQIFPVIILPDAGMDLLPDLADTIRYYPVPVNEHACKKWVTIMSCGRVSVEFTEL
jgi:hypothetical protein